MTSKPKLPRKMSVVPFVSNPPTQNVKCGKGIFTCKNSVCLNYTLNQEYIVPNYRRKTSKTKTPTSINYVQWTFCVAIWVCMLPLNQLGYKQKRESGLELTRKKGEIFIHNFYAWLSISQFRGTNNNNSNFDKERKFTLKSIVSIDFKVICHQPVF